MRIQGAVNQNDDRDCDRLSAAQVVINVQAMLRRFQRWFTPARKRWAGGGIDRYRVGGYGNESREQVALGVGDRRDMAVRGLVTQKMTDR